MGKLKLKKSAKKGFVILIGVVVLISFGFKVYRDYRYKQTYEYKLIEHGYSMEEAQIILNACKDEQLEEILAKEKDSTIVSLVQEKYYIPKNLDRYLAYAKKNTNTSYKDIVTLVNVYRDYNYYEHDIESNTDLGILLLVNKYYKLKEDFEPLEISDISIRYSYQGNKISKEANDAYVDLWHAANEAGYTLIVNSSYRNYQEQESVYHSKKTSLGQKKADEAAARPGYSEHQSGLAIDVFELGNQATDTFKVSNAYHWLQENAYKYGFIERYPEGKENITGYSAEAWHWRYVGKDVAKIIQEEQITFDEYYAYYIENQAS